MKNLKRTFKFTKGNIRFVVVSVLMIILVQVLNFLSPLIVKNILDDCILGIEYDWVEVKETIDSKKTVNYDGRFFKHARFLTESDQVI